MYATDKRQKPVMVHHILYRQVIYIVHAILPKSVRIKTRDETQAILAIVQWCDGAEGDATMEVVWYSKMGTLQAVNIATIENVVGRVQVEKQWGILDMSFECTRTTFVEDEDNDGDK
jgi:hypothetical protein